MATLSFIPAHKLAELVQSATELDDMYIWIVSSNELALGKVPLNAIVAIDLSKEALVPFSARAASVGLHDLPKVTRNRTKRRSGDYWFELHGKRFEFKSLGELLAQALRSIEADRHGTLEKLSHVVPRSKRIVSREKTKLFTSSHLSDDFSEQLMPGWWYGTNNSTQETKAWLRRACDCAGLKWELDFRSSLT